MWVSQCERPWTGEAAVPVPVVTEREDVVELDVGDTSLVAAGRAFQLRVRVRDDDVVALAVRWVVDAAHADGQLSRGG